MSGYGPAKRAERNQPHADGALLGHLMRVEVVELARGEWLAHGDHAGRGGRREQLGPRRGAGDDRVEARVLALRGGVGPRVADDDVGGLADRVRADLAPRLKPPRRLVLPHLVVAQLVRAPVTSLDPGGARITVAAVAEQSELALAHTEAAQDVV